MLQIFGVRGFFRGFHSLSPHFVVFIHGERDLSSLPCLGGAAVQISLKIGGVLCCWSDLFKNDAILDRTSYQKNLQHRVNAAMFEKSCELSVFGNRQNKRTFPKQRREILSDMMARGKRLAR